jgi:ABC transporter substrate binding protein (PQQ-dependent alcohol dehydrogenase system)
VLLDIPSDAMISVAQRPGEGGVLFNVRHRSLRWRTQDCAPGLLHTIPSYSMLTDALAQHLRSRRWSRILLISGKTPEDIERSDAVRRSAAKFGLSISEDRTFELTNDPRRREQSNIALLTGGSNYDVIWLVDEEGEFGRYIPFATYAPRPVIGAEGLTPNAWHWTYERHGAPQLNQRFRRDNDRDMTSEDWAAWVGVRAIVESVSRVGSANPAAVAKYMQSESLSVDLYKGVPGSFRPWNGQLRQPILLATHNATITRAPVEGFEHRTDTLDTLGIDRAENRCNR